MLTLVEADTAFDQVPLNAFAANGGSITVALPGTTAPNSPRGIDITNGGADDLNLGDLIMLVRGSASTLVQITRITNQQVFFDAGDSLGLNQAAAASGNARTLYDGPDTNADTLSGCCMATTATRIRLITYYLDVTTDPRRPRLVRRMNNGHPTNFDNALGTVVAFDIEDLQVSYDIADGIGNPANVRLNDADLDGSGACDPDPCSPNQVRKINLLLAGRSRIPMRGTNQFFRNRLVTQVSLRSLSFVDRYQ
jgi:hypothetical protein